MEIIAETFTDSYTKILDKLYKNSKHRQSKSSNPTAKQDTKEIQGLTTIIQKPRTRTLVEPERQWSKEYFANELAWYLSGESNIKNLGGRIERVWEKYADEQTGAIHSNYGNAVFHRTSMLVEDDTQWNFISELMKENPETRRAVIQIIDPNIHTPKVKDTKDFPCNVSIQFLKNGNELDLHIYQRSCDLINGYCYDIPWWSTVLEMMAIKQELLVGRIVHHSGSMHIYNKDNELLEGRNYTVTDDDTEMYYFCELHKRDVEEFENSKLSGETPFQRRIIKHLDDFWKEYYEVKQQ